MNDKDEKLETVLSKTYSTPLSNPIYTREAEQIKKDWFNQLVTSMEKMQEALQNLRNDYLNNKTVIQQQFMQLKEDVRKDIQALNKDVDGDTDKLEERLNKRIDSLSKKISTMLDKNVIDTSISAAISKLKTDLHGEIVDHRVEQVRDVSAQKEALQPVRESIRELKTKIAMWGVFTGVIGGGIGAFILYLIKMYFFKVVD